MNCLRKNFRKCLTQSLEHKFEAGFSILFVQYICCRSHSTTSIVIYQHYFQDCETFLTMHKINKDILSLNFLQAIFFNGSPKDPFLNFSSPYDPIKH